MRLDKYICTCLGISRRQAKKYISSKKVSVNGALAKKGEEQVEPEDKVLFEGRQLIYEEYVYILLNKPRGVVSASADKRDVTVVDLVQKDFPGRDLFPAGRLDKTSTGMVIITDDGAFAHNILSPSKHVPKTYIVTVDKPVTRQVVQAFRQGVTLADGQLMKPAEIYPREDGLSAKIVLRQGVYHQIKRMLGVYGIGVNSLHRTAFGALSLPDNLPPGGYIKLNKEQIEKIGNGVLTEN